ncbi:Mediator of RNA polymerase II transcription subunit 5 [Beauveria bassiana D1-5]|uniref:Mediator of RNA polymerase II transcription subunit 5 n=1 Tax=Beauveria bassiana D1-5 TaxID=1245745 RepID=A0A0A2VHG7_BEABA|nr:Mediator of RNA polymerase II transcription subunit 5 [Beauveria bassiana D1-5]
MDSQPSAARAALQEAVKYWSDFVARCIVQRLDSNRFLDFVQLVHARHPLPPVLVADLFLRPQPSNRVSLDPRIPPYVRILAQLRYVDAPSILRVLYKYSALHAHDRPPLPLPSSLPENGGDGETMKKEEEEEEKGAAGGGGVMRQDKMVRWQESAWAEEVLFYHVIKTMFEGTAFTDAKTGLELVDITCKWMDLFVHASSELAADMLANKHDRQARDEMETVRAALVPLLLRLVDNHELLRIISKPFAKGGENVLASHGCITVQPPPLYIERLEIFRTQTLAQLDPIDEKKKAANAAMEELLDSTVGSDNFVIPEILISNSRAALYVYLNAALVARPVLDDSMLYAFLSNKYQENQQASAVDLIVASFDVLANAVFRNEGPRDAHLLRSFVVNKLPLLLCQLCHPEFSAASAEFCITEALSRVDTGIFPTASLMFDESRNNNPYMDSVREEFCAACALHGLIERDHVDRILGETSMSYDPSLERANRDRLVSDCLSDSGRIQNIISQLDRVDGNVGAVAHAIVELIRQLCNNKDTTSLKLLCLQLSQKPQSLDIILLFDKVTSVLEPVCTLLDNWNYEEDQGEYQPVYEEYGAILLLVFAFTYRYNLSPLDIGIQSADSHVAKIIAKSHMLRPLEDLNEQEAEHVAGWITGLFDNETGGLGDDLMSSCPPHEFYLLVAPIFQSIITAYTYGYINDESLKGGVEYLVDTFLLPSLVPAIRFFSISGEASTVLSAVKNLIAQPLEHALRTYQRQDPRNQDIEPLLRSLKENLPLSRRTGGPEHHEMVSWANNSNSGLSGAIRHTMQGLVQWSLQPGVNVMPTSYTHRQLITGLRIIGPSRLLRLIMEEIRQQSELGNASIVYDVAAALIAATDPTNEAPPGPNLLDTAGTMQATPPPQRPQGLREALKTAAEGCKRLQKHDQFLAEATVRLHRMLLVVPQPQAMLQTTDMPLDLGGDAMAAAAAAAAAVGADPMSVDGLDTTGLDTTGLDLGLGADMGLSGGGSDGDLFGGLDTSLDMFDGWDSMDMGVN